MFTQKIENKVKHDFIFPAIAAFCMPNDKMIIPGVASIPFIYCTFGFLDLLVQNN